MKAKLKSVAVYLWVCGLAFAAGSCGDKDGELEKSVAEAKAAGKAVALTTTTMVTDLVQQIGGDKVMTLALMGPGVDPHLYKSKAPDTKMFDQAEVVFYSGLMLEGRMTDVFESMKQRGKKVFAVAEAVPVEMRLKPADFDGHYDPHVWGDASLWSMTIDLVVKGLSETAPGNADYYEERGEAYKKELAKLHEWAKNRALEIPEAQRVLISSHDAFEYFGRAYGIRVIGVQGISTATETPLAAIGTTVKFIQQHGIKAVFGETSVSDQAIRQIANDAGVKLGGELFSDAMGTPGDIEEVGGERDHVGTYVGMLKHNMNTVIEALK